MGESIPPFPAIPLAEFTSERARRIVAKIAPDLRGPLAERVREALQFHHEEGEADAVRFCILMLDALRSSGAADDGPPPEG